MGSIQRFYEIKDSEVVERDFLLKVLHELDSKVSSGVKTPQPLDALIHDIIDVSVVQGIINEEVFKEICIVSSHILSAISSGHLPSFASVCDAFISLIDISTSSKRRSTYGDLILRHSLHPLLDIMMLQKDKDSLSAPGVELIGMSLRCLNSIIRNSSLELRNEISFELKKTSRIPHLFELLTRVGDYDVQVSLVETIFRLLLPHKESHRELLSEWLKPFGKGVLEDFLQIRRVHFDVDVRNFLVKLNWGLKTELKVHSIPCKKIEVSGLPLYKPRDDNYNEFWVDFNEGTRCLLINCLKSNEEVEATWDALIIKATRTLSAVLNKSKSETLFQLKLKYSASSYFDSSTATEFEGKDVEIYFDVKYDLTEIVRRIFGKTFKEDPGEASSSNRTGIMYDRRKEIMYDRKRERRSEDESNKKNISAASQQPPARVSSPHSSILDSSHESLSIAQSLPLIEGESPIRKDEDSPIASRTRNSPLQSKENAPHQSSPKDFPQPVVSAVATPISKEGDNIAPNEVPLAVTAAAAAAKEVEKTMAAAPESKKQPPPTNEKPTSVKAKKGAPGNTTRKTKDNENPPAPKRRRASSNTNKKKLFNHENNFMELDPSENLEPPPPKKAPKGGSNKFFKSSTPLAKEKKKNQGGEDIRGNDGFPDEVSAIAPESTTSNNDMKGKRKKKSVCYAEVDEYSDEQQQPYQRTEVVKRPLPSSSTSVYDKFSPEPLFKSFANTKTYGYRRKASTNPLHDTFNVPIVLRDEPIETEALNASSHDIPPAAAPGGKKATRKTKKKTPEDIEDFLPELQPPGEEYESNKDSGISMDKGSTLPSMEYSSSIPPSSKSISSSILKDVSGKDRRRSGRDDVSHETQLVLDKLNSMETAYRLRIDTLDELNKLKATFNSSINALIDKVKSLS